MSWNTILKLKGFFWSLRHVFYRLDKNTKNPKDVKEYLNFNVNLAKTLDLPRFKGTRDERLMSCYMWVCDNIKYKSDKENFGVTEHWENIDVILKNKSADCESMATLVFCMARIHGINPLQLKFVCGEVPSSGHAWLEYQPDYSFENESETWYIFDPAYDPFNNLDYSLRVPALNDDTYVKRWFSVNDLIFRR